MREVELPSGAVLKVGASPFAVSKALYQAVLADMKEINFSSNLEVGDLYKEFFCIGFSSPKIEKCLKDCFKRCTYNSGNGELKIDNDTFEPIEARDDYITVCIEVARENISPFVKSLYAEYKRLLAGLEKTTPK